MGEGDRLLALLDLLESAGWKVLTDELLGRIKRKALALKSQKSTPTLESVRGLQEVIAELEALLKWPEQEVRNIRANLARESETSSSKE